MDFGEHRERAAGGNDRAWRLQGLLQGDKV